MEMPEVTTVTRSDGDETLPTPLAALLSGADLARKTKNPSLLVDLLEPTWVRKRVAESDYRKIFSEVCSNVGEMSECNLFKYELLKLAAKFSTESKVFLANKLSSIQVGLVLLESSQSDKNLAEELELGILWLFDKAILLLQPDEQCHLLLLKAKLWLLLEKPEDLCLSIVDEMGRLNNATWLDSLAIAISEKKSCVGLQMATRSLILAQGLQSDIDRGVALFKLRGMINETERESSTVERPTILMDDDLLCEYPHPTSGFVNVLLMDYRTLKIQVFLNDVIIDFYLGHLFYTILSKEDRESIYVFSSMFYNRLVSAPPKNSVAEKLEEDLKVPIAVKRHRRVQGWTKDTDLFVKKMLVVPICENSHWFLVLVLLPEEGEDIENGHFVVLDSVGLQQTLAVTYLRQYLAVEWLLKKTVKGGKAPRFSMEVMKIFRPSKPEQSNSTDCGIFLLQYVEEVFKSFPAFCSNILPDLSSWFTVEEVERKREGTALLIRNLSAHQRPMGGDVQWPALDFYKTTEFRPWTDESPPFDSDFM